ncbi:MAG: hypothetical protein IPK19_39745 [Chloroflexi bacterium]|nr:hypothetical protein [Chloroflexota bacterium]
MVKFRFVFGFLLFLTFSSSSLLADRSVEQMPFLAQAALPQGPRQDTVIDDVSNFHSTIALATTRTVTTLANSGAGSRRQAVLDADGGDTIVFAVTGMITLNDTLVLDKNLTILGPAGSISLQPQDYSSCCLSLPA